MPTYKEQISNRKNFVLIKNGEVLGTFGNLRKLCDWINDESFLSYWTLVRRKKWPQKFGEYEIWRVNHA